MGSTGSVHSGTPLGGNVLLFPPFRIDHADKRLWHGDRPVPLKPKSFSVLHHLLTHAGRLVTKQELLDAVWHDVHVGDANVKTAIKEIRQALGDSTEAPRFVATVHRYGYRFIHAVEAAAEETDRPDSVAPPAGRAALTSGLQLAGREAELSKLEAMLTKASAGERRLAVVTGPPGIGKSTLLDSFLSSLADRQDLWLARGQCLPNIGDGEPYLPLLEMLGSLCRGPGGNAVQSGLARHAPAWLAQLPALLTDAELDALQRRISGMGPERMLRQMVEAVEALSDERPVILCFDDLQWCDRATLELIDALVRRQPKARLLVVGAYRSTEIAHAHHPLLVLKRDMQIRGLCVELALEPLPQEAVATYCAGRFGTGVGSVPNSLPRLIHERSGGHPLFMTAIVDELVRRDEVVQHRGQRSMAEPVRDVALPASVWEFVTGEFERLEESPRRLLEAASVLGTEFSVSELAAALAQEAEKEDLETLATALARRKLFLKAVTVGGKVEGAAEARFAFRHDLYREVVYAGLTSSRRGVLHRQIGEWLEQAHGDRAAEAAGTLAVHFAACEDWFRAARYHRLAGEQARRRHAPHAAADHARRGIAFIENAAPGQDRHREELMLLQLLAVALITSDGFAAEQLSEVYARADELCRVIDDLDSAVVVLCGFWNLALNQGDGERVREVTDRLLSLAGKHPDSIAGLQAHNVAAQTSLFRGEFEAAEPHLERCLALHNPNAHRHLADSYGENPGVVIHLAAGWTRWAQGYPDQARRYVDDAVRLGRAVDRPFAAEQALWGAAVVHQHCGDTGRVHACTEEMIRLCRRTGASLWLGGARILRGWALARSGHRGRGIASLRRGIDQWRATETVWLMPYYLCLLGDVLLSEGTDDEASGFLEEAEAIAERTGERWYDAERCRLAGEHARRRNDLQAAESWFRQGLDISRRQGAASWELRGTISLADLWRKQHRVSEAHDLLAAIHGTFTEGTDTEDVRRAREFLDRPR